MEKLQFDKYFDARNELSDTGPRFFVRTSLMKNYLNGLEGNLLDAGCGEGNFLNLLIKNFGEKFSYTGIDVSKKAILLARKKIGKKANLIVLEISAISGGKKFDVIVCGEVLEHIKDDGQFLQKICELCSENGHLVLSVPLDKKLWSDYDIDVGHFRRYEKKELLEKLLKAGFEVKKYSVWGFPLMRTCYSLISRKNRDIAEKNRHIGFFLPVLKIAKYFFLLDNFFNFTEKGVGIVVLAKKRT